MSTTHHTPESRAAIVDAKARAAAALTACGDPTSPFETVNVLKLHCARRFFPRNKYESTVDYFNRVADTAAHPRPKHRGEIVQASDINLMTRGVLKPSRLPSGNPRMDGIDDLPSPVSMSTTAVTERRQGYIGGR